jgi:hypothetical protein
MRLVAFGIFAALTFGAGCALEAGDPGEPAAGSMEHITPQGTPKVHPTLTPTTGVSSAAPPNPEPSPWFPTDPGMADDSTGNNPEPSPWLPQTPSTAAGTSTEPQGTGTGTTSGNSGSTPTRPGHHGSL